MSKEIHYEISKENVVPFIIPVFEFPIAVIELDEAYPGRPVSVEIAIGWRKPPAADRGELELILRKQSVGGPELMRSWEVCPVSALARLNYTDPEGERALYFLLGRSAHSKACIEGPIRMKLSV